MSRAGDRRPQSPPLIALVDRAHRQLQADMVRGARNAGFDARSAHNAVFATLPLTGARTATLAAKAGITRQSMGEVVRELVDMGLLEMKPDPEDRRAKLVTYTEAGLEQVNLGRAHIADVERRLVEALGEDGYQHLRDSLQTIGEVLAISDESDE
jgi:DNA-binding MarR family transcriptional regulator